MFLNPVIEVYISVSCSPSTTNEASCKINVSYAVGDFVH